MCKQLVGEYLKFLNMFVVIEKQSSFWILISYRMQDSIMHWRWVRWVVRLILMDNRNKNAKGYWVSFLHHKSITMIIMLKILSWKLTWIHIVIWMLFTVNLDHINVYMDLDTFMSYCSIHVHKKQIDIFNKYDKISSLRKKKCHWCLFQKNKHSTQPCYHSHRCFMWT